MPEQTPTYEISGRARKHLDKIHKESCAEWGIEQTEIYFHGLHNGFTFLAENPQGGTACDNIRKGYRRFRVARHMIYYRPAPYGVAIMAVLHDRMDAKRHL